MNKNIMKYAKMLGSAVLVLLLASCDQEIDNWLSRNHSDMQFSDIPEYIKLDEDHPDDVALNFSWCAAHDYGNDYITVYKYQFSVDGSAAEDIVEYEDDGKFSRSYTNAEMQQMLVEHFGQMTSSPCKVIITVTASFEGPQMKVPDVSTASFTVKTYGPKQFLADQLFVDGTAVADGRAELSKSDDDMVYTGTMHLKPGKINFPVIYADEQNAVGPLNADEAITTGDMPCVITDEAKANSWIITEEDNYRVNINLRAKTVRILAAGALVEADQMFLAGSATGGEQIEETVHDPDDEVDAGTALSRKSIWDDE